jgi:hypothetical protein
MTIVTSTIVVAFFPTIEKGDKTKRKGKELNGGILPSSTFEF